MQTEILVGIIGAASALLGTLAGGVVTNWSQSAERHATRRDKLIGMATSLSAEIEAYIEMVSMRKYVQHAKDIGEAAKHGHTVSLKGWITESERVIEHFPTFRSNSSDLGILGIEICRDLARFHSSYSAVRATIIRAEEGHYDELPPSAVAALIEQELGLWEVVILKGERLIVDLRGLADTA